LGDFDERRTKTPAGSLRYECLSATAFRLGVARFFLLYSILLLT